MDGDGNGWVECSMGHRHWGLHGAAGLLLYALAADGEPVILMQHRAAWTNEGDTWGVPGGARDSHEDGAAAALREAYEEAGILALDVNVREVSRDDHGGWTYDTVLADTASPLPTVANRESESLAWVAVDDVESLPLHPGFAGTWLRHRARPMVGLAPLQGQLVRDDEGSLRIVTHLLP